MRRSRVVEEMSTRGGDKGGRNEGGKQGSMRVWGEWSEEYGGGSG